MAVVASRDPDPDKCEHYAQFAAKLQPLKFDIAYWILFLLVMLMLFCSSWYYGRSMEVVDKFPAASPEHRRQMKRCMTVCGICAVVSVAAVVMETFALLALQFCDGEDLMMLMWSTWTMLQVGSVIAIFGIILSVFHSLRGRKHPPWTLALGTPVLVLAGLGHFLHSVVHNGARTLRERVRGRRGSGDDRDVTLSEVPTLQVLGPQAGETPYNARLVGYTPQGGPILQFAEEPEALTSQQVMFLSTGQDGQVIVAFRKELTTAVDSEKSMGSSPPPAGGGGPRISFSVLSPAPTAAMAGTSAVSTSRTASFSATLTD